ncbi:MarR family winged helix-turn-helix transcriptional regulator [Streptomyces sp. NPDC000961]|uniref:MarR family winged helix-turn-helix transcriptional regulator n=1 Tax=Streptomyces sp. NPDC000961 TaxID=3364541 RepID=UPI0036BCEEBF
MSGTSEWLDGHEEKAWNAFFEMQMLFWPQMARRLQQDTGLSEPDFAILGALARAPEGRLRPYELSGVTQFEKSRLHHHLTRMAGRGLITRERCPGSSRGAVVALTPRGREAVTGAFPRRAEHVRRWLTGPLTPAQLDALTEISGTLAARLRAESEGAGQEGVGPEETGPEGTGSGADEPPAAGGC